MLYYDTKDIGFFEQDQRLLLLPGSFGRSVGLRAKFARLGDILDWRLDSHQPI
jgi:hypothetical protein